MPCYNPLTGYRSRYVNESGKRPIVFKSELSDGSEAIPIPCGQCIGCRLEYSRQWAMRCYHESQLHQDNAFITLTYNDENLPVDRSISKRELQLFVKRLRKAIAPKKIRFFACGEYGSKEKTFRPHYHAIIFGYDFPDRVLHTKKNGHLLFTSKLLDSAWQHKGHALIGAVTFESAAYVARYVTKKRKGKDTRVDPHTGRMQTENYDVVNPVTGEVWQVEPEFCLMSRRPGIGREWFEKFRGDVEKDFVTLMDGQKVGLPQYYDRLLEKEDEEDFLQRKEKRKEAVDKEDNTRKRLKVKEVVKEAQLNQLKRGLENEC